MFFKNFQNSKIVAISACIGILNIGLFTSTAQAKPSNKSLQHTTKSTYLETTPNRSLDLHLLLSRRLAAKVKSTDFKQQSDFALSELQPTIPLKKQKQQLIANSFAGQASWYGPGFHGRRTASGTRYNQNALTAAHPYLKFGTRVKVTNLNNGRSVIVKINDRGPYAKGRIIDVSAAAARSLNMIRTGVAPVSVTVLGR